MRKIRLCLLSLGLCAGMAPILLAMQTSGGAAAARATPEAVASWGRAVGAFFAAPDLSALKDALPALGRVNLADPAAQASLAPLIRQVRGLCDQAIAAGVPAGEAQAAPGATASAAGSVAAAGEGRAAQAAAAQRFAALNEPVFSALLTQPQRARVAALAARSRQGLDEADLARVEAIGRGIAKALEGVAGDGILAGEPAAVLAVPSAAAGAAPASWRLQPSAPAGAAKQDNPAQGEILRQAEALAAEVSARFELRVEGRPGRPRLSATDRRSGARMALPSGPDPILTTRANFGGYTFELYAMEWKPGGSWSTTVSVFQGSRQVSASQFAADGTPLWTRYFSSGRPGDLVGAYDFQEKRIEAKLVGLEKPREGIFTAVFHMFGALIVMLFGLGAGMALHEAAAGLLPSLLVGLGIPAAVLGGYAAVSRLWARGDRRRYAAGMARWGQWL